MVTSCHFSNVAKYKLLIKIKGQVSVHYGQLTIGEGPDYWPYWTLTSPFIRLKSLPLFLFVFCSTPLDRRLQLAKGLSLAFELIMQHFYKGLLCHFSPCHFSLFSPFALIASFKVSSLCVDINVDSVPLNFIVCA